MKRLLFITLLSALACTFVAAGQFRSQPMGEGYAGVAGQYP